MTLLMVLGSMFAVTCLRWTGLNWGLMMETGNYLPLVTHIFVPYDLSYLLLEWILVAAFWHNRYSKYVYGRTQMAVVFFVTNLLAGGITAFIYSWNTSVAGNMICGCVAGIYGWFGYLIPDVVRRKEWQRLAKTGGLLAVVGLLGFFNIPLYLIGIASGAVLRVVSRYPEQNGNKRNVTN